MESSIVQALLDLPDVYEALSDLLEITLKWAAIVDRRKIQRFKATIATDRAGKLQLSMLSEKEEREWLVMVLYGRLNKLTVDTCPEDIGDVVLSTGHEKNTTSMIAKALAENEISEGLDILLRAITEWICALFVRSSEELHAVAEEIRFPTDNWDIRKCSNLLLYMFGGSIESVFERAPFDIKYWKQAARMP